MADREVPKGKIGFLFHMGHGHYAQFLNFQECFPPEQSDRPVWIPLWGDHSGHPLSRSRLLPGGRRYSLNQMWNARHGIAQNAEWDALFFAAVQSRFLQFVRRHRTYFYIDLPPSCIRELAYEPPSEGRLLRAVKDAMQGRVIRAAAGVFTMSEWAKRGIVADYGVPADRVHVALPGANLPQWSYVDRRDRPAGAPKRILMVGGWFHLKGGPELLEWAERAGRTDWEMDMVTWWPHLPEWVRRLREPPPDDEPVSFTLAPRLPRVRVHCGLRANTPEIKELYARADLFCLPTVADASSIASLEAMASGLPVAVNAVGGIPELVRDGETGLLMRPHDTADMAAKLERLLDDRDLRLRLGEAARKSCEDYYNVARQMREIVGRIDSDVAARR